MGKFGAMRTEKIEKVSISLTLDTRRTGDEVAVAVRVNYDRKTFYYRTGYKCSLAEWEKLCKATGKGNAMKGTLYQTKLNQIAVFEKVKQHVQDLVNRNEFSIEKLKVYLTGKASDTFNDLWRDVSNAKSEGTRYAYLSALNSFAKYVGDNVPYSSIGEDIIRKWHKRMEEDKISVTTIGMYSRACRVVMKAAIKRGLLNESKYPFHKDAIRIKKGNVRNNDYLPIDEIKKLMNFHAPSRWRESYADVVYEAIDLWIFSYLANGMNVADMSLLTWNDHYFSSQKTELSFIRKKTMNTSERVTEIFIPIIPELKAILDRRASVPVLGNRVFPFILGDESDPVKSRKLIMLWNSNIQDRVMAACKEIGIEKRVSPTWARHSFATNLTFAGVSERYISQAMGHSLKTVTQGYIGLFPPEKRYEFNLKLISG